MSILLRWGLILGFALACLGCGDPSGSGRYDITNSTGILWNADKELYLVDPETKEAVKFEPCTTKPGPDQCEIYKNLFMEVKRKTIFVTNSMRPDNTRCCKTVEMDGEYFETCKTVSGRCSKGWYKD